MAHSEKGRVGRRLLKRGLSAIYNADYRGAGRHFYERGRSGVTNVAYVGTSLIEFQYISLNTGLGGAVKHLGLAAADLYSTVFETAGILLGKKRLAGAFLAAVTATGIYGLHHKDIADFSDKLEASIYRLLDPASGLERRPYPKDTDLFAEGRALDFSRLQPGNAIYNPDMLMKYRQSSTVRSYVDLMVQEARANNIDPVLFVNQLYQESISFHPDVIFGKGKYKRGNNKGAVGIAQFLPSTAKRLYGVSKKDLEDPFKAIPLAAKHMGILTHEYHGGDQILAMVSYNGGESEKRGPVAFVERKTGDDDLTGEEWFTFMDARRGKVNRRAGYHPHAWHNETFKYVAIITGASWSDDMKSEASQLTAPLTALLFNPS